MRKVYLLGTALVAVFAFSAVIVSAAFAEEALWLFNSAEVTTLLPVSIEGELTLSDLKAPGGVASATCSGFFDGSVGPGEEDEITKVLNLEGTEINELGGAVHIKCEAKEGACEKTTDIELQPENLPWLTELEFMSNGEFLDLITSIKTPAEGPGWNILCLILGLNIEDLCVGNVSALIELMEEPTGMVLLGIFEKTEIEKEGEQATCSLSKEKSGVLNGSGIILDTAEAGELDVSSP